MHRRTFLATLAAVPLAAVASPKVEWKTRMWFAAPQVPQRLYFSGAPWEPDTICLRCGLPHYNGVITNTGDDRA